MPITAGYSPAARNASTQSAQLAQKLSGTQQVLASGQRTIDPSKDPASAAVGATLKGDVTVFQQLIRNTNNAVSVLNYSQAALSNVTNLLTQMKQIATQAIDPTLDLQLGNLDLAFQALVNQVKSIGANTAYLGTNLLDGSFTGKTFQVGLNTTNTITVNITQDIGALTSLGSALTNIAAAQTASTNIDSDIQAVSALIATIGANQTQLQASLDQLGSQLGAESQALDTTTGADINDTLNDLTTFSAQLEIAQSMIENALKQQSALAQLVKSAAR